MDPPTGQDPSSADTSGSTAYASHHVANVAAALRAMEHPQQVGPYRIIRLVAEGGMGAVYEAEQLEPIRRTVAIKVIRPGRDTAEVIARFDSERQALAVMDHPNIAKVFEAGATETGRPYFVMEYVAGEAITFYSDRKELPVPQRLELFSQACAAVQHAHQKGLIHRDLKPSNILVAEQDGKPVVKVIDFGVAKAISQQSRERTLFTEAGQFVGTPEYMAPEQAEAAGGNGDGGAAQDVDTRADVYSLGVVLYELLSGTLPFDPKALRSAGYLEIHRIICEVEPPRPSTRLSGLGEGGTAVARARGTALVSLSKQLRGELEWIPLKALRKERDRRYATASELAEDVGNYLAGRPLRAGPESAVYRARKFVRRNRRGMTAAAVMLLLLIGGIVATSWQAVRATRAEARIRAEQERTLEQKQEADRRRVDAETARAAAAQVNDFLVGMFEASSPQVAQGKPVLASDVLDDASETIGTKLAGQPRVESAVRSALGRTYFALGLDEQAEKHFAAALEIDRRELGDDDPQTITSRQHIGQLRRAQGKYEEAREIYADTLARRRRVLGQDHIDTIGAINDMAVVLDRIGAPEAEETYREALRKFTAVAGPDDLETLRTAGNLGQLLQRIGKYEESEQLLRQSYEGRRRVLGDDHPDTIGISTRLAYVMKHRQAWDEAEALMRDALERSLRVFGKDHPSPIWAENGLAQLLSEQGKFEEAIPRYLHAVEESRRVLGSENIETLGLMQSAAASLSNAQRYPEAEALLREAHAGLLKLRGPDFTTTIRAAQNLAIILRHQERWDEALPFAKDGYERLREPGRVQMDPRSRARYLCSYGVCLSRVGRHEEAIERLTVARTALKETGDAEFGAVAWVLRCLVDSSTALGRAEDAAKWAAELEAAQATTRPSTSPATTTAPAS